MLEDNNSEFQVALIGPPASGKTTMLTALQHYAPQLLDPMGSWIYQGADEITHNWLREGKDSHRRGRFREATGSAQDLRFNLFLGKNHLNINIQERPGDDYVNLEHETVEYLAKCKGLIFLISPAASPSPDGRYVSDFIENLLLRLDMQKNDGIATGKPLDQRVAVCLSQYDDAEFFDWLKKKNLLKKVRSTSIENTPFIPSENVIRAIREWPKFSDGEQILNHFRARFKPGNVEFFALSSIGFWQVRKNFINWSDCNNVVHMPSGREIRNAPNYHPVSLLAPFGWIISDQPSSWWINDRTTSKGLYSASVAGILAERYLETETFIQQFFNNAGFIFDEHSSVFLCSSSSPSWKDASTLYLHILRDKEFDYIATSELLEKMAALFGDTAKSWKVILILRQQPTHEELHQLFAIKSRGITIVPISIDSIKQGVFSSSESQILRKQIDLYIGRSDLYDVKLAVGDVLSFYGRHTLIETLKQKIANSHSVIIYGLRKIGKSSLMSRLCADSPWPVASVDVQGYIGSIQYVYNEIIEKWVFALTAKFPEIKFNQELLQIKNIQDFREGIEHILDECRKANPDIGLALFLDEVDILEKEQRYFEFSAALRRIAEDPRFKGHFMLLFAGLEPVLNRADVLTTIRNPLFSFFEEQAVQSFTVLDARRMVLSIGVQMGIAYEENALDLLVTSGGGHPFVIRQLCSYAIRDVERPTKINLQQAQQAINTYLRFSQNYFAESLWMIDSGGPPVEETVILKSLARTDGLPENALLLQEPILDVRKRHLAFDHMRDQNIIVQANDSLWHIAIPLYRMWIRKYILSIIE